MVTGRLVLGQCCPAVSALPRIRPREVILDGTTLVFPGIPSLPRRRALGAVMVTGRLVLGQRCRAVSTSAWRAHRQVLLWWLPSCDGHGPRLRGSTHAMPGSAQISIMARPRIWPSSNATRASSICSREYRLVTSFLSGNLSSRTQSRKSGKSVSGSVAPRLPQ
jgi:hypothetical protein